LNISQLETPALLLDKSKLETNIGRIHSRLAGLGVNLRPHGKTAKNINIIEMALIGQSGGITVSTLKEAEYYLGHGITDIVYAVGIAPVKLERVAGLIKQGARLTLLLDSVEQVRSVAQKGREHGLTIPALIELDCDGHRSGLVVDDPLLLDIGRLLQQEDGTELAGVLTHAGESYQCKTTRQIQAIAESERNVAAGSAELLRRNGLPCPIVSVGSTPTVMFAQDLTGITEVRAGVFMFHDLVMAGLNVCAVSDIAISVLTSIIGHQEHKGWVITDAGWMAMSRDRGTASQEVDQGYGLVCNRAGKVIDNMIISDTNQEHGIVSSRSPGALPWDDFALGSMLRVLPNHACATGAMFDRYYVLDGGEEITDIWPRVNGW
jgi:D-serine deaminase-like pyridoxal phosphate-dependent protein